MGTIWPQHLTKHRSVETGELREDQHGNVDPHLNAQLAEGRLLYALLAA